MQFHETRSLLCMQFTFIMIFFVAKTRDFGLFFFLNEVLRGDHAFLFLWPGFIDFLWNFWWFYGKFVNKSWNHGGFMKWDNKISLSHFGFRLGPRGCRLSGGGRMKAGYRRATGAAERRRRLRRRKPLGPSRMLKWLQLFFFCTSWILPWLQDLFAKYPWIPPKNSKKSMKSRSKK